jgi:hypothetical protein
MPGVLRLIAILCSSCKLSSLTSVKQPPDLATRRSACHNVSVADDNGQKKRYVDPGWPTTDADDHAVSELAADRTGALSPFGDVTFPLPADKLPFIQAVTKINR